MKSTSLFCFRRAATCAVALAVLSVVSPAAASATSASPSSASGPSFFSRAAERMTIYRGGAKAAAAQQQQQPQAPGSTCVDLEDISIPVSHMEGELDKEGREKPLLRDIDLLSDILSDIIMQEDEQQQQQQNEKGAFVTHKPHDLYDQFRQYGLERANTNDPKVPLEKMIELATQLTADEALFVMRSFSIVLNLVNSAEVQHRYRLLRQHESQRDVTGGPLPLVEDSIRGTMESLLHLNTPYTASADAIFQQLQSQWVEIVLTAHPTQVQRKSLLRKYRKVSEFLNQLETSAHPFDIDAAQTNLKRVIGSIWGADEIRRTKPTPQQEAAGGNAIVESVLWDAVPEYVRKLDAQCRLTLQRRLPVECVPIRFASWIGGDRDGNPNVTPHVTLEVALQQRLRAARMHLRDMYSLMSQLTISSRFSKDMDALADTIQNSPHKREKYRRVLGHLIRRLVKTARDCEQQLALLMKQQKNFLDNGETEGMPQLLSAAQTIVDETAMGWEDVEPIRTRQDLMEPLKIMYDSLVETGFDLMADGSLVNSIRRVAVFGVSLMPLDIREESTRHTEALDAITRYLGIGSYKEWSEEARLSWLQSELASKRPFFRMLDMDELGFDDTVINTLRTFDVCSQLPPESLGAYVISQAQTASDVLAVMLLQKQFGMTALAGNMMRVVPLFETLDDLTNAPKVLNTLFTIPVYVGKIKGKQEVMVGYSDSAKDAGRLAACWSLYISQELMSKVASDFGIELTFFHGKGGTVSRGGNPSVYRAIMSHPPKTVNGRFRVTEQGEMITQNFGTPAIAERTLDIYTAAICREAFHKHVEPNQEWRSMMDRISEASCAEYRYLVREEARFVPYFRQATPELELGTLNIGSRPAKRNPKGGIESLRAIPWTFAWTQTRVHLPAWLGVSAGLSTKNPKDLEILRSMYKEWPWFRETIDLIAMILSKTDYSIAANYDKQLVEKKGGLIELGEEVRKKLVETRQAVLAVTESKDYSGPHVALMRASNQVRHPFVDPVNVIQAELLKRLRALEQKGKDLTAAEEQEKETLQDALIVSINGIAQGMRNSG